MRFWAFTNKSGSETENAELRIEGDIVSDDDAWINELFGIKATSPNAFRQELANYRGKPLTVWIDSYGGDVFAAAGIYNALRGHDAPVTVKIDGKAMSAASVIAMAGQTILMSPVALMMIHNPLTIAVGDMHEMRHVADILDEVKNSIINAYQLKTKHTHAKISEMMDDETYMSAKKAIKERFADGMLDSDRQEPVDMSFTTASIRKIANASNTRLLEIMKRRPPDQDTIKARMALEMEL